MHALMNEEWHHAFHGQHGLKLFSMNEEALSFNEGNEFTDCIRLRFAIEELHTKTLSIWKNRMEEQEKPLTKQQRNKYLWFLEWVRTIWERIRKKRSKE